MTFQRTGMVWVFDFQSELLDTNGIPGVFAAAENTSPDDQDGHLYLYFWPHDDIGWIPLYGAAPPVEQLAPSLDGDAGRNVLYWDDFTNTLAATNNGLLGDRLVVDPTSTLPAWLTPAPYQATPADPTGTNSTTGVMMGLGASITPLTTRILILASGDIQNSSGSGGGTVQIRYGTGTAPANGDALTGDAIGGQPDLTQAAVASNKAVPFALNAIQVAGLSAGTTYWIDLALAALNTGTASIKNISISALDF